MLVPSGYSEVVRKLSDSGSVSFVYLGSLLENIVLQQSQIQELERLTVLKVKQTLILGNFKDLAGVRDFLSLLGVEKVTFGEDWIQTFTKLKDDSRLTFGVLYDMSPYLIDGKIEGKKVYEKIPHTYQLLLKNGFSSQELSQDFLTRLWEMREMLIYVRRNEVQVNRVLQAYTENLGGEEEPSSFFIV